MWTFLDVICRITFRGTVLPHVHPVADLDDGPALAHHLERLDEDLGLPGRFDDQVGTDSFRQILHLLNLAPRPSSAMR